MSKRVVALVLSVGLLFAARADAAQLVPITEVPNSVLHSTVALGLNDSGRITGSYVGSDGLMHGFVGPIDGPYRLFDAGPNGTAPRAISNSNLITGYWSANKPVATFGGYMFEASPSLVIAPIKMNGVQMVGIPQGMNDQNVFVGSYHPANGGRIEFDGFYGRNAQYTAALTLPFPTVQVRARAITTSGTVVGLFLSPSGASSGFILKNGTAYIINYPDPVAVGTDLQGINDAGEMTGSYMDADGNVHAFLLAKDMQTFTLINIPGSTFSQAWAINRSGEVVVAADIGPYLYCSRPGIGHCTNGKAKFVESTLVHGGVQAFNCINGCLGGAVAAAGPAVRLRSDDIDLRQRPYWRPQ